MSSVHNRRDLAKSTRRTSTIKKSLLIALLMMLALGAVVFSGSSVSVESSSATGKRQAEPSNSSFNLKDSSGPATEKSAAVNSKSHVKARVRPASTTLDDLSFTSHGKQWTAIESLISPLAPVGPVLTATKNDALAIDVDSDTLADPGDTIEYTVNIGNAPGTDATGVIFTDTISDTNLTFVGGSVKASAVAVNDSYPQTLVGNVSVNSATISYSVASNDFLGVNPTATITAFDATSANGGTVTMTTSGAGIGQFTYDPPAGFEGTDTFTYTLSDDPTNPSPLANRKATVSLNISGMVWFIDNNAGACSSGCDGRLSHPFTSLANFQTLNDGVGNHPADNDNIFLYQSNTAYVGPVTLRSNQRLIGQDATVSLSAITGLTPPTSSPSFPTMFPADGTITKITSGANAINLNSSNTTNLIRGLTVGNTTGSGIAGSSGVGFGTLTIADTSITDAGTRTGQALDLTTGTLNATIANLVSSSATNGVKLTNINGTLTIGAGSLSTLSGADFLASGGAASITFPGTITNTAGRSIDIQGHTGGTILFSGAINDTGTGIFLDTNTGATINFTAALTLSTGASPAFTATGGGTVSSTAASSTITTTTGTALNVANTTISASGLTFQKISVTGNNTLPASGIILNNTGTSGSLKVTGNGSPCTPATPTCTGGEIQGTGSHGVALTSTKNVEFNLMSIHNTGDNGIDGNGVDGFILRDCRIFNFGNATPAGGATENGLNMTNLTGTATIQRDNIGPDGHFTLTPFPSAPENDGITVRNTNVAPLVMNVTGTKFFQISNDGIDAEVTGGTATLTGTLNVDGSTGDGTNTFDQINGRAVVFSAPTDNSSLRTLELTIKNNTFNLVGIGGRWFAPARTTMNARFNNNTMTSTTNDSIRSESDPTIPSGLPLASRAIVNATVSGNDMGGGSIFISNHREAIQNMSFLSNTNIGGTAAGVGGAGSTGVHTGINLRSDRGSTLNIDLTGNTATADGSLAFAQSALYAQVTNNGGGNSTICAKIGGAGALKNTFTENPDTAGQAAVVLDTGGGGGGTIALEGWNGAGGAVGAQNFIIANNTINASNKALADNPGVIAGGDCVTVLLTLNDQENQRSFLAQADNAAQPANQAGLNPFTFMAAVFAPSNEVFSNHSNGNQATEKATQPASFDIPGLQLMKSADKPFAGSSLASQTIDSAAVRSNHSSKAKAQPAAKALTRASALMPVGPDVNLNIGTLPVSKNVFIKFRAQIKSPLTTPAASVSNQGHVHADGPIDFDTDDPATGAANDPTVTPLDSADLQLTKTDSPDPVSAGSNITYTLNFKNNGPSAADTLSLTDAVPANTTLVSVTTPAGWSRTDAVPAGGTGTLSFSKPTAANQELATFTIVVKVDATVANGTTITNSASVTSTKIDPDSTNNTNITATTTVQTRADLAVTKVDSPDPVIAGNNITYTVNFVNNGPSDAQSVTLTDAVPANTTLVSATTSSAGWSRTDAVPAGGTGNVVFSNASVASGATATFTIVVNVNTSAASGSIITNNAVAASTTTDPTPGNNTGTATTTVNRQADLELTKVDTPDPVNAGDNLTYTLSFINHGPSDASTVTVTDATPANTTLVSVTTPAGWSRTDAVPAGGTGTISFSKATVANQETASFTIVVKVNANTPDASTINNSAVTSSATTDPTPGNNTGTASTTVINQADLAVTKMDSPDPVNAGSNITYTIHVVNNGPGSANTVGVSDAVPANTTFVSAAFPAGWSRTDAVPVGGTGTITFAKSSMINGETADLTLVVKVNANTAAGSTITNHAVVTSTNESNNANNDSGAVTTTVATSADISVTKTDSPDPVTAGTNLTYAITITNNGPSDAQSVQLTDATPANTTFVSEQQNTGPVFNCTNPSAGATGTTTCTIATLASGASATFQIVVHVDANTANGSTINNSAVGSSTTTDPTPGNNTGTASTTVNSSADLEVTKTDTPDPVIAGNNITYTVNFTNHGPSDSQSVTVTDAVPANTTLVSATTASAGWNRTDAVPAGGTGNVVFAKATVANAETATFTIVVKVNSSAADGSTITNNAVAASSTPDATPGNNTGTATTTVNRQADLELTKTDSPDPVNAGDNLTYTLTLTNHGPSDASTVTVNDATPANTTLVSVTTPAGWSRTDVVPAGGTGTISFAKATVANAETATFTIVVKVNANAVDGSTITNSATRTTATTDPTNTNDTGTATTTVINQADLAVTKSDSPDPVNAGNNITYTIHVVNNGPGSASTVTVTDAVPTNTTFVSAAFPAGWSRTDAVPVGGTGNIVFAKATVANGETADLTLVVKVNANAAAGSTISNSAVIASATTDMTPGNNNTGTITTTVATSADISVTKTDAPDPVNAGNNITYTITITNNGPSDAQSVQLTDATPTHTTFVSEQQNTGPVFNCTNPSAGATGTTTCTIATLASGASAVFEIVVHVDANTAAGTTISNSAVGSTTTSDATPGNNTGTATTTVNASADLEVTKTDSPDPVVAGTDLTYTVTVTNHGPSDAQSVQLTDATPANTTFVSEQQNTGPVFNCTNPSAGATGTTTCTIATLASGASAVFEIKVHVNASTAAGTTITNNAVGSTTTTDPTPGNNTGTATTTVSTSADVSITKDDSPDPVNIGQNLTYTITVTNNGPSDAQTLALSDALPTHTTFVSLTVPAGWTRTDAVAVGGTGTITATNPTLAASAISVFTLVVKVDLNTPQGTMLSNTGTVSSATTDPTPGNNSDTETTAVNSLVISGRKFTDVNGNGNDDVGTDPGLNGVTIELYNDINGNGTFEAGTDTLAASTTTANVAGQDGKYSFAGITPGKYLVREVLQTGYLQTAPAAPGLYAIDGTGGGSFANRDFGNFQLVTISGRKFNDLNGNGNDDGGTDPGLNGVTIELYNDVNGNGTLELSGGTPDTLKDTKTTATVAAVDGKYSFTDIGPGKYIVREIVQAGYLQTAPAAPGTYAITTASGVDVPGRDFGNFRLTTTTAVTSSLNPSFFTDPVTFTATVSANPPGSGTPTGTVNFFDGANPLCTGVLLNGSGQATCMTAALAAGNHVITAVYSGDSTFATSTGMLPGGQTVVAKADLAVTKVDSPDPVIVGNDITYTISFTNNGPSAADSVTVTDAVPANTTLVSATTSSAGWSRTDAVPAGGTGNVVFAKATVASGETATFQIVVNVNAGTADLTVITNNAVAATTTTDLVNANNTGTATTTVRRPGVLQFSAPTYTVSEGAGTASIDVTRTGGSNGTVTVHYTITNGTASSADYTGPTSGTLTFGNGVTTQTISIPIVSDSLDEVDETLNLALDTPTGGALLGAQTTAVLTITDDDPTPSLSINDVTVAEGNSGTTDAVFTVTLSAASGQTVTVNYATADGTATIADNDYQAKASTQLTFLPGETTKTVTIKVNGDTAFETPDEDFFVNLSGQTNSTIADASGRGVITNDDAAPTLSINDVALAEGNSGTTAFNFTVTLTGSTHNTATVNYATADGTATAPSDYTAIPSTQLTFLPGETTKTVTVLVNGDTNAEANETFFVNLSGATNATITDGQGQGTITSDDTPLIGLSASSYSVTEDGLHATIVVNRLGDLSQPARVDYLTSDPSGLNLCSQITGNASSRCDYATTAGTLRYAAGETSKTIYIPIVDDVYLEGPEVFTLTLSNAVGGDISGINTATITIIDNDTAPAPNPIDNDAFFIRQLYIDFLGREPEPGAVNAWLNILNHCTIPTDCDRIAVARGFVRSPEFQDRGFFVYRTFKTLGRIAHYSEFIPDMARVSGFLSAQDLEANKDAYVQLFMNRLEFKNLYDPTIGNPTAYVDKLLQAVELPNHPSRGVWIAGLTNNTLTRTQVLRQLIDSNELYNKYVNEAFIIMNYFGFLRRDADSAYLVWFDIFNHSNDDRIIINGFMNSPEYRLRFGP